MWRHRRGDRPLTTDSPFQSPDGNQLEQLGADENQKSHGLGRSLPPPPPFFFLNQVHWTAKKWNGPSSLVESCCWLFRWLRGFYWVFTEFLRIVVKFFALLLLAIFLFFDKFVEQPKNEMDPPHWSRAVVGCLGCWAGFTGFLPSFIEFLLSFSRTGMGFVGLRWFYWILPGFLSFYWVFILEITEFSSTLPDFTGFTSFLLGFTEFYWVSIVFLR